MQLISEEIDGLAIDWHAHVFLCSLPMAKNRRYAPRYDARLEDYLARLTENHLSGGLIVQPSFLGDDNSFLLSCLAVARKHAPALWVGGVAVVPPHISAEELARYDAAGVVGVRLNLFRQDLPDFLSPVWTRFFDNVNALDWHVEVQLEGWRWPHAFAQLSGHCKRLVIDHFGLPDVHNAQGCAGQGMICAHQGGNIWVKTSAPYRVYPSLDPGNAAMACRETYRKLRDSLGEQALLWGSDWPWTRFESDLTYREALNWRDEWRRESPRELTEIRS